MIKETRDQASGLQIYVASCDDCGRMVAVATQLQLVIDRLQRQRPQWRPDDAVFCVDTDACAERTWQRYGRYLQLVIEREAALQPGAAPAVREIRP